jgi:hypothetical protein
VFVMTAAGTARSLSSTPYLRNVLLVSGASGPTDSWTLLPDCGNTLLDLLILQSGATLVRKQGTPCEGLSSTYITLLVLCCRSYDQETPLLSAASWATGQEL